MTVALLVDVICRSRDYSSEVPKESAKNIDMSALSDVQLSDLVWN